MDQLVQCPVCTLFLHNGMSLESHLDTHPKDQVIKALCSLSSKTVPSYASRTPTPSNSERSYRSRSRTPATEDRWSNSNRCSENERLWRRTPSRTPKQNTVSVSRQGTPDIRIGDINFENNPVSNINQYSAPPYHMKPDKIQPTYMQNTPMSEFDQPYVYYQDQQEDREIKYSRSAEYSSMDCPNNIFPYNMPGMGSNVKLQTTLMPPISRRGNDIGQMLPKPNNILLKTNMSNMQYLPPGVKPMHVVVPSNPTFVQKNVQNNMIMTGGVPSTQLFESKAVPTSSTSNQYTHMPTGSFTPATTVVTQNSQIIYREMVHNIDGKPFISTVPAMLNGHDNVTNVAQASSMYQNVMVVDPYGNTSCMYASPQQILPKSCNVTYSENTSGALHVEKTISNVSNSDSNKTLIIEVGPIGSIGGTLPKLEDSKSSIPISLKLPIEKTEIKNDIPGPTRGLKILSNIKVEVPVQHHKSMLNTIMDLTGSNESDCPIRSIAPEKIDPDSDNNDTIMSDDSTQPSSGDSIVSNTFSVIKNIGKPPSYKECKSSPIDTKIETDFSDSCPVPNLICNEQPSISPCSELSEKSENSTDYTSLSPKPENFDMYSSDTENSLKKEGPQKLYRNNALLLNNLFVKKNKKVLQIKNARSFPISTPTKSEPDTGSTKSEQDTELTRSELDTELTKNEIDIELTKSEPDTEVPRSDLGREPTKSEIDTEPTKTELDFEPTKFEPDSKPTMNELDSEPKNNELVSEPTNNKLIPEPINSELMSEQINNELVFKATNNKLIPKPTNSELMSEQINNELVFESTNNNVVSEPTTDSALAESVPNSKPTNSEPDAELRNSLTDSEPENNELDSNPINSEPDHLQIICEPVPEATISEPDPDPVISELNSEPSSKSLDHFSVTVVPMDKDKSEGELDMLHNITMEKTKENNEFDADTEEQSMDIEPVTESSINNPSQSSMDIVKVIEEINLRNEGCNSKERRFSDDIDDSNHSDRILTPLETSPLRPINVISYGNMAVDDFDEDSNEKELLDLEAASKSKQFVSMINENYFGDNIYADYFTPDRPHSFENIRDSTSFSKDATKDRMYLWGEPSQKENEFVLPNFIHESYKIAESNELDYSDIAGEEEQALKGDGGECDSKANVLNEAGHLVRDVESPVKEQNRRNCTSSIESTWKGIYPEVSAPEPYDLMARESWISDGSDVDSSEKRDSLDDDLSLCKSRVHSCSQCGAKFTSLKELRLHSSIHMNPTSSAKITYSRLVNSRIIKKEEKHDEIILNADGDNPLSVDSSETITSTMLQVYDSMREEKPKIADLIKQEPKRRRTKNYVCPTCKEDQVTDAAFHAHLKIHPLECLTCGKCFYRRANLALHLKTHLGIKNYKCDVCEKRFITRQKLTEHQNVHTGRAPVKCTHCPDTFRRYSNMVQHRNRHHFRKKSKIRDYVCHCGAVFHSRAKMLWHKETHDEKPKACLYCSDKFVHSASLTRHVRRSHNEYFLSDRLKGKVDNVPCPVCKQVYLKTNIRAHLLTHSGKRPYLCIICNKAFTTKWNLKLHRWTHMSRSAKPYKCHLCKGAFIRQTEYISHLNAHKSVRPYTCNYCGCQFIRKYNCQRHVREHEMAKKYVCKVPECGKSFHRSYYLAEHMKVHSGARPFACNICGKTSSNKSNHNKHIKIHHAREPVAAEA